MLRRVLRSRTGFIACAAILVSAISVFPAAQAASASVAGELPTSEPFYLLNNFNGQCLNGYEAADGGVQALPCDISEIPEETWVLAPTTTSSGEILYALQNTYNGWCVNGREGTGVNGLKMEPCDAAAYPQELWSLAPTTANGIIVGVAFKNNFNGDCLNGREGVFGVTVQPCDAAEYPQELWSYGY
jgi:hypothetical protein